MQILISTLTLVAIIGFIVWWGFRDVAIAPTEPLETTQGEVPPSNSIIDSIDSAKEVKKLVESKNLIALDLSEQGLVKVPAYVFERIDLESLDLSDNNLTGSLQGEIRILQNLKALDLSGNTFTGVPAEIGQLSHLETLDLRNNMLTGLPYELGNLKNLKLLRLSGNHYSVADLEIIKKGLPKQVVIETE